MKKLARVYVILVLFALVSCISYADCSLCYDSRQGYADSTQRALSVERLYIQTYPEKTVYKAFDKLNTSGLTVRAVYSDGSEGAVKHEDLIINYKRDDCLRAGDDGVTIFYLLVRALLCDKKRSAHGASFSSYFSL